MQSIPNWSVLFIRSIAHSSDSYVAQVVLSFWWQPWPLKDQLQALKVHSTFFYVLSVLIFQNFGTLQLGTICHDWYVLIADYKPFHYSFPWVYEIECVFSSAGHWESLVPEHKDTVHSYQNRKFWIFLGNDISFFSLPSFIHLVIVKIFMHMCMLPVCERRQIGGWQFFSISPGCYSCVVSLWREILGSPPEPISGKGRCSVIASRSKTAV